MITIAETTMNSPPRTLAGHQDWITACAFSPDGLRIISGSDDHTLMLWDADTGNA